MNPKNLKNAVLEALRLIAFSVPGILIQVVSGDAALAASYGGTILVVLRAVDRAIHDSSSPATGILPF